MIPSLFNKVSMATCFGWGMTSYGQWHSLCKRGPKEKILKVYTNQASPERWIEFGTLRSVLVWRKFTGKLYVLRNQIGQRNGAGELLWKFSRWQER